MMKCKPYRSEIEETPACGDLSAAARAHLDACAYCREFYREQTALKRMMGELEMVAAPNDFEFRLRARLAAAESEGRRSFLRRSFVPGAVSIGLAAVFALAVALSLQLWRRPDTGQTTARSLETAQPVVAAKQEAATEIKGDAVAATVTNAKEHRTRAVHASASPRRGHVSAAMLKEASSDAKPRKSRPESIAFSLRPAPSVGAATLPVNDMALTHPPIAVQLHTPSQPLKVVLRDERGGERVVSMKSVSFGSQQLVGRMNANSREALASKEGVW